MIRTEAALRARLDGARLTVDFEGRRAAYGVRHLATGGNNAVYALDGAEADVVVRVSLVALDARGRREYAEEVATQRRLAAAAISPRVYATLEFGDGRLGMAMERFAYALDAVLRDARLTARLFVGGAGEARLVELFVRAARAVSCVDTKAANVVVRLEPEVRLALIDVDVKFCGVAAEPAEPDAEPGPEPGPEGGLEAVDGALARFEAGCRAEATLRVCRATVSLTILCLDVLANGAVFALLATARALYARVHVVMRLLHEDEVAQYWRDGRDRLVWMGASLSAMSQIRYYIGIRMPAMIPRMLHAAQRTEHAAELAACVASGDEGRYVAWRAARQTTRPRGRGGRR
jgi:hypothetical protein